MTWCCDTAIYLIDISDHEHAGKILEDCASVLKTEIRESYPKLLYKVHYRQAALQNALGLNDESLVYLKQAIGMAEEQE